MKVVGKYLVIGASNGAIRFYDFFFRISAWFEVLFNSFKWFKEIGIKSITSISFATGTMHGG